MKPMQVLKSTSMKTKQINKQVNVIFQLLHVFVFYFFYCRTISLNKGLSVKNWALFDRHPKSSTCNIITETLMAKLIPTTYVFKRTKVILLVSSTKDKLQMHAREVYLNYLNKKKFFQRVQMFARTRISLKIRPRSGIIPLSSISAEKIRSCAMNEF